MTARRLLALAALVLGAGLCAAAPASAVTNAPVTSDIRWSVELRFDDDSVCSGLVLTTHWIVTAAHCLAGRSVSTDQVEVLRQGTSGVTTAYPLGPGSYYNLPGYGGNGILGSDVADDLGILRLYGNGVRGAYAKIYDGPAAEDPDNWRGADTPFQVAGYGWGSDVGSPKSCDAAGATIGPKRIGRFQLTGRTYDHGWFGLGNPVAVEGKILDSKLCGGDSGAPWVFSVNGEYLAFAVHSTSGDVRKHWSDGVWGVLLPRRMKWIIEKAAEKGVPIECHRSESLSTPYRWCREESEHPTQPQPPIDDPVVAPPAGDPGPPPVFLRRTAGQG
jgi:hypothetical protein